MRDFFFFFFFYNKKKTHHKFVSFAHVGPRACKYVCMYVCFLKMKREKNTTQKSDMKLADGFEVVELLLKQLDCINTHEHKLHY